MKLRNKKTGEIIEKYPDRFVINSGELIRQYDSLAELNAEWEDAPEEPKKYWFIDAFGNIIQNEITKHYGDEYTDMTNEYENQKQIGNYFETEKEAEKAVEKLKAWKRLEDKGFRFERWLLGGEYGNTITFSEYFETDDETRTDLDLLFGDEE